ncbi:putative neutral sphingomyelinase isoform X2 [Hydra vulgaris]|uniref:putative neutral sphingomyelinase isoform X2 n=2 Tax=Hydra vulgaris TaxID=6087 RepID=UPI000641071C|nr:putative neutral sphingomyelinase isoform X1 [Hydra vulgaris]XP_047125837.1 putative neutral sphingomyelinase isoform X1 [Hydra vulgaris]
MAEIKVLTLNVWGLLYISKDVEERMDALAEELKNGEYDIIALQEVWVYRHFELICAKTKHVYPYCHYFHSGFLGSGCASLSRYPIIDTFFIQYKYGGNFWNVFYGDWFAGKGLGCILIQHPLKEIYVFNTHLHASYPNDSFKECRTLQLYQTTQILKHMTRPNDAVIFCGDFNHTPDEIGIKALSLLTNLSDTYDIASSKISLCHTINPLSNSYLSSEEIPSRIDYTFVSKHFQCTRCDLAMQKIPGKSINFSDHEGYATTLIFDPKVDSVENLENPTYYNMLKTLHKVIMEGELRANKVHRRKIGLVILLVLFVFMPIIFTDIFCSIFPSISTFSGKIVFIVQIVSAIFCTAYAWIVIVLRRIDSNSFKDVMLEIHSKIMTIEKNNINIVSMETSNSKKYH